MQGVLGRHICPRQVIFRLAGAEKPALLAREVIKILKWRISFFVSAGDYIRLEKLTIMQTVYSPKLLRRSSSWFCSANAREHLQSLICFSSGDNLTNVTQTNGGGCIGCKWFYLVVTLTTAVVALQLKTQLHRPKQILRKPHCCCQFSVDRGWIILLSASFDQWL